MGVDPGILGRGRGEGDGQYGCSEPRPSRGWRMCRRRKLIKQSRRGVHAPPASQPRRDAPATRSQGKNHSRVSARLPELRIYLRTSAISYLELYIYSHVQYPPTHDTSRARTAAKPLAPCPHALSDLSRQGHVVAVYICTRQVVGGEPALLHDRSGTLAPARSQGFVLVHGGAGSSERQADSGLGGMRAWPRLCCPRLRAWAGPGRRLSDWVYNLVDPLCSVRDSVSDVKKIND